MVVLVCTGEKAKGLKNLTASCPTLQHIIVIDKCLPSSSLFHFLFYIIITVQLLLCRVESSANNKLVDFKEVEALGKRSPSTPSPSLPSAVATISYTGGATGAQRGVVLTHVNLVSNLTATLSSWPIQIALKKSDVYLSYLSLALPFERIQVYAAFSAGGSVAFSTDATKVFHDLSLCFSFISVESTFFSLVTFFSQKLSSQPTLHHLPRCLMRLSKNSRQQSAILGFSRRCCFPFSFFLVKISNNSSSSSSLLEPL